MFGGCCFVVLLVLSGAFGEREGRWFNRETRSITTYVTEMQVVTEITPSSCVVVQTSLPSCRHLRSIVPTQTTRIMQTETPQNQGGWKPVIHPSDPVKPANIDSAKATTSTPSLQTTTSTTPSSWGWNFFNLSPKEVIVTQTVRKSTTTKFMDPNTMVTFSVKGCRPSRLPFDLPECQSLRAQAPLQPMMPPVEAPEKGIIVMAPIQFVPPMTPLRSPDVQVKDEENPVTKKEVEKVQEVEEIKNKTI